MSNPQDVLKRFESVKGKSALQKLELDQIRKYLQGNYYDTVQDGSTLRDEPKYSTLDGSMELVINTPYLTVQDNVSLAAQDPQIDVPPKDEKSESHALKLKKIHYATYEHSGGNWLMQQSSFYERAYGWSIIGAQPNLKERRIDIVTYDPRHCWPVFKLGSNVFLKELFVSWKASPQEIKDSYPNYVGDPDNPTADVDFIIFHGSNEKMFFAGGEFLSGIKHDYDFCPFVVVPCMQTPDGYGIGDVHQTVGLAIANNKLHNLMYQYIYENVNADTAVMSDDEFEPPVERHKRFFWHFSKDSRVEKMADTSGRMLEGFRMAQELQDQFGAITGTGSARRGEREGMYVSAGGQAALSRPLGDRIDNSLKIKSERMSLVLEYVLRLYEKHFMNTKLNLYGKLGMTPFEIGFKGKDIKGYYRTNIMFLPSILADAGNRMIQVLQLNGSGLLSDYTSMNMIGIADPEFEKKQREEEQFEKAKLEGNMQRTVQEATMPVSQPGNIPDMGNLGGINPDMIPDQKLQLEKGRTNETADGLFGGGMPGAPAMQPQGGMGMGQGLPGGEMPMSMLPPSGGGVPPELGGAAPMLQLSAGGGNALGGANLIMRDEVMQVITSIPKIRGAVFIVGALAEIGSLDEGQQLELMITNPLDKATLINGLRKAIPNLDGNIVVHVTKGIPQEENIEVPTGGVQDAA